MVVSLSRLTVCVLHVAAAACQSQSLVGLHIALCTVSSCLLRTSLLSVSSLPVIFFSASDVRSCRCLWCRTAHALPVNRMHVSFALQVQSLAQNITYDDAKSEALVFGFVASPRRNAGNPAIRGKGHVSDLSLINFSALPRRMSVRRAAITTQSVRSMRINRHYKS